MKSPLMNGGIHGAFPDMGNIQNISDHPDNILPEPGHSPTPTHSMRMAGDVLPIPGELSMGPGMDERAVDYATGKKSSENIKSIGMKALESFLHHRKGK